MLKIRLFFSSTIILLFIGSDCYAFSAVDKIYHPYVETNTWELETRAISELDNELAASLSVYRLGIGKDITENLFVEFYAIGNKDNSHTIDIKAYEIEVLYQYTEQGEYWADVGFLFEIEQKKQDNEWEGNFAVLIEKEFGKWSATLNLHQQFVFINDQKHEWEFKQALQYRYRYSPAIEPGFELYIDQNDVYLGAVLLGGNKLWHTSINWEVGLLQALSNTDQNLILRMSLETEF
ncbi:MAG: hypothetical protein COA86_18805 [Kangiella sp.]|nr:MAG: hypothetical protein COA86_18805 [Kangiella sp.]